MRFDFCLFHDTMALWAIYPDHNIAILVSIDNFVKLRIQAPNGFPNKNEVTISQAIL